MKHIIHNFPSIRRMSAPAAALCTALVLSACLQSEDEGQRYGKEDRYLSGRVVSTGANPVAGVAVHLAKAGVSDTTDALGRYHLLHPAGTENDDSAVIDTLFYQKHGQVLARVSLTQWVDSLPDVQIVQRDISGLLTGVSGITRVEAVVTGDGIDSAAPVVTEFYYNALTGNYSGFVFFPPANSVQNYLIHVNIYGADSTLVGQSQTVPFNSFAGNITIPTFSAGNSVPVVNAGTDTAVGIGETIALHATAVDSFGGTISKWEWSIGGDPFVETSSGDTSFTRGSHGIYAAILRVTDDDGNLALDTSFATVVSLGTEWTTRDAGTTRMLHSVVWADTQFVAVGDAGTVLTSPDGITWSAQTVDTARSPGLRSIAWSGKKLVAVRSGSRDNEYYTSHDGVVWTLKQFPQSPVGLMGPSVVSSADSTLLIASRSNTSRFFLRSEDHGETWFMDTLSEAGSVGPTSVWAFTRHAGRFVGVGGNGVTASSLAGGTWARHTNMESFPRPPGGVHDYTMTSVISTGMHAVAVGYAGHVMRSVDGTTWQQPRVAGGIPLQGVGSSLGDLLGVTWTGNTLVAVGSGYSVISADGGANWAQIQTGAKVLNSVAWNGTRLVAVGVNEIGGTPVGTIVTSP